MVPYNECLKKWVNENILVLNTNFSFFYTYNNANPKCVTHWNGVVKYTVKPRGFVSPIVNNTLG